MFVNIYYFYNIKLKLFGTIELIEIYFGWNQNQCTDESNI